MQITLPHVTFAFVKIPSITPAILNMLMVTTFAGAIASTVYTQQPSKMQNARIEDRVDIEDSLEEIFGFYSHKVKNYTPIHPSVITASSFVISASPFVIPAKAGIHLQKSFSYLSYLHESSLWILPQQGMTNGDAEITKADDSFFQRPANPQTPFDVGPPGEGTQALNSAQSYQESEELSAQGVELHGQIHHRTLLTSPETPDVVEVANPQVPSLLSTTQNNINTSNDSGAQAVSASPSQFMLPSWNTYQRESNNPLFVLWLMKAVSGNIGSVDAFQFRNALIKTLLSSEFQSFINQDWETENDNEIQNLRRDFFYAYIKAIDWSKTSFRRLYLIEESEDMHTVDLDAFTEAYEFPLRLEIHVYRMEDLSCDECRQRPRAYASRQAGVQPDNNGL